MVRGISPRASRAAVIGTGRHGTAAAAMFLGIVFAVMPFGTRGVSAADALTATDWQYLRSIGRSAMRNNRTLWTRRRKDNESIFTS